MLLISLLLVLSSIANDVINGCEFGVPHEVTSYSVFRYGSSTGTQVYLGLENPASCGGYLRNYTICQLNRFFGRIMTPGILSIWEPAVPFIDGLNAFSKIKSSDILLPLEINDTCGVDPTVTTVDPPTPEPADEFICFKYCFPEHSEILVKPGSVPGVTYSNGIRYQGGQILSDNTRQTKGLCVGGNHRFSFGDLIEVTCPLSPANLTTGLLAGADIEPIYCPELSLQYGNINISGPYSYGTGIEYTCQTGFQLVGVSSQTCLSSGDWSDELPYCNVLNCTDPGVPSNGNRDASNFTSGSTIVFTCNEGYTLHGGASINCFLGNWTSPLPACNLTTTEPSTPDSSIALYRNIIGLLVAVIVVMVLVCCCGFLMILVYKRCSKIKSHEIATLEMRNLDRISTAYDYQPNQLQNPTLHPYTTMESQFGLRNSGRYESLKKVEQPYMHPPSIGAVSTPEGYYAMYETLTNNKGGDESYWAPANVEQELYNQLERIKVKRIPSFEIKVLELLGSGYFATVNRAMWLKPNGGEEEVAVKVLSEKADNEEKIKFLQEAALMGQFKHTNVLTLHGVISTDTNVMIVTELMKGGDLHHWLLKRKVEEEIAQGPTTTPGILLNFCRQVCLGMCYLSSRNFVHRDLAARNILVTHDNICKVSDFGMSRDLDEEEDYYLAGEGLPIPVKWTAPEAIKQRKYSSASDVWSYGCLMYEIWSLGHKPFATLKNSETLKTITTGKRLAPPPGCPRSIYEIMIKCWHPESKKRPAFNDVMLLLLKDDSTLLLIPDEDRLTHSDAAQLGAPLEAGDKLYTDLQSMYIDDA